MNIELSKEGIKYDEKFISNEDFINFHLKGDIDFHCITKYIADVEAMYSEQKCVKNDNVEINLENYYRALRTVEWKNKLFNSKEMN